MTIDTTTLLYGALGFNVLLILWHIRTEMRFKKLLRGTGSKSIEDTLAVIQQELAATDTWKKNVNPKLNDIETRLSTSMRAVATNRFNAFGSNLGGNQSFATTFLDEHGDGVILSSIYARERVSTFAKPIKRFNSTFELSDEEKTSLEGAKNLLKH